MAVLLTVLQGSAQAAPNTTTFVSRASGPDGAAADENSFLPSISANGRLVAFQSNGNNLSDDDDNAFENIFVRDLRDGTTRLVSRASGPDGAAADAASAAVSISGNGRFVAFQSDANNLSDDDADGVTDIFVRDRRDGTTRLVSLASGANGAGGDMGSFEASISADGRFVAFQSDANNLSDDDADGVTDIFVRDRRDGTTRLVSLASGANGAGGDANSQFPSTSAYGRFVAFQSDANNLSDADADDVTDIFVRER